MTRAIRLAALSLLISSAGCATPLADQGGRGAAMTTRATGSFEVILTPQKPGEGAPADAPGRMTIDKRFSGDLVGSSVGEMLAAVSPVKGSAAYVAMERVTGRLNGREGGFVLVHRGFMTRGSPELSVTVAPDSGTGALTGLTGTMQIDTSGGGHDYVFDYALPPAP